MVDAVMHAETVKIRVPAASCPNFRYDEALF